MHDLGCKVVIYFVKAVANGNVVAVRKNVIK